MIKMSNINLSTQFEDILVTFQLLNPSLSRQLDRFHHDLVNVGGGEILQKDKIWRQTENTYYVMRKTCRILHKYDHR